MSRLNGLDNRRYTPGYPQHSPFLLQKPPFLDTLVGGVWSVPATPR